MPAELLAKLGAKDEADAVRIVDDLNAFLGRIAEMTGEKGTDAQLAVIKAGKEALAVCKDLEKQTEKPAAQSMPIVLAWKSSHEQQPKLETRIAALEEEGRKREVAALIQQGRDNDQLTPAHEEYFAKRPAQDLKDFLAIAPKVYRNKNAKPPAVNTAADAAPGAKPPTTGAELYENLAPKAKADLKRADPEQYAALRNDWIARGKPSGTAVAA